MRRVGDVKGSAGVRLALAAGALMLVLGGCAPTLQAGGGGREHVDLSTLTREQMAPNHFHTAYEAVQALRGNWFNVRPHSLLGLPEDVAVYLDNIRLGGVAELQNIPLSTVEYIRHFDATEATTRWGLDHTQGVIYVSTHPFGSAAGPSGG